MIGDQIRLLREREGITQAELARRLGTSRATVNSWESDVSNPTLLFIVRLTKEFRVTSDYLLGLETEELINITEYSDESKKTLYSIIEYMNHHEKYQARLPMGSQGSS